jgi:hypothetical protein
MLEITVETAVYNMMNLPKNIGMNFQIIIDDSYFPFYLLSFYDAEATHPVLFTKLFKTYFFLPLEKHWIQSLQICELPPTCLCVAIESV